MIVLDTHVLLWLDRNDDTLGPHARAAIETAWRKDAVAVSAVSFWEAATLHRAGRIALPVAADRWRSELLAAGIQEIPVDGHIGIVATELTNLHRDPADRFIIATALRHDAELITADAAILDWKSDLRRRDARS
jgi:PIN domain nuclease of toxin-antitoxin system